MGIKLPFCLVVVDAFKDLHEITFYQRFFRFLWSLVDGTEETNIQEVKKQFLKSLKNLDGTKKPILKSITINQK